MDQKPAATRRDEMPMDPGFSHGKTAVKIDRRVSVAPIIDWTDGVQATLSIILVGNVASNNFGLLLIINVATLIMLPMLYWLTRKGRSAAPGSGSVVPFILVNGSYQSASVPFGPFIGTGRMLDWSNEL